MHTDTSPARSEARASGAIGLVSDAELRRFGVDPAPSASWPTDGATGLVVYSLYGETRTPTPRKLRMTSALMKSTV